MSDYDMRAGLTRKVREHKERYSPRLCVEGFALRIRKAQESGSSVLITIGHDRLEAYASGIEAFLAEHAALLRDQRAMEKLRERGYSLIRMGEGVWHYRGTDEVLDGRTHQSAPDPTDAILGDESDE